MTDANRANRAAAVMARLSLVGDLIILQFFFVLGSLGIVTLVPAAFALQRMLPEVFGQQHPALSRRFWHQFKWAFRRFWLVGLGLYVGSIGLVIGILFWISTGGVVGVLALAVLIPLAGLLIGLYLSALAVLPGVGTDVTPRGLLREANVFLVRRPLAVAAVVVAVVTWLLLVVNLPTLYVIGSGLVPALLAYWISPKAEREPPAAAD